MRGLRKPGLGPIVGHTTSSSCRLWIRADDPADEKETLDANRRTVGVIAVLEENGKRVNAKPAYFRLHREYDRTGTFNLGVDTSLGEVASPGNESQAYKLKPDTLYCVGLATLTIDDPSPDDETTTDETLKRRLPPLGRWMVDEIRNWQDETALARFRTFPASDTIAPSLAFVVGSCRYPGLLWKIKLADRIFGPLADQASDPQFGPAAKFVLMVGDQIYADRFNRFVPIGRADTYGEFQERYLTAFGSMNMRRLLRTVPTYMILDDHEISDDWTQDRLKEDANHFLFTFAIGAYMSYQWSHGPRTYGRRLHYNFECGGYPFFVLDTRTQRYKDDVTGELDDNHMLGRPSLDPAEPNQLDCLLDWLKAQQKTRENVPKFIVSSSVFVPNDMKERQGQGAKTVKRLEASDSWPAYPETRKAILRCITDHEIQNVVFLSGDVHCSNVAEILLARNGQSLGLRAYSVTSSAFYWPFPFADGDPANYVHDSRARGQEDTFAVSPDITMDYKAWNFTQEDNYCRLVLDRSAETLAVRVFDQDGKPVERETPAGRQVLQAVLQLAPW